MRSTIATTSTLLSLVVALAGCGPKASPAATAPAATHGGGEHHGGGGEHHGDGAHAHAHPHVHHRFDDAEKWSKVFDDPARDAWQQPDEVVKLLALRPGMTVADLGAGTGYFLARLSAAVGPTGRVLGLDVEDAMVSHMTERAKKEGLGNVTAHKVAPDDPALPAHGVDRVLVVDTWHHLGDRGAYAAKLAAGLAPGGFVLVVDFTKESKLGPPVAARVTPEEVIADLKAGGLSAIVVDGEPLAEQFVVLGRL